MPKRLGQCQKRSSAEALRRAQDGMDIEAQDRNRRALKVEKEEDIEWGVELGFEWVAEWMEMMI